MADNTTPDNKMGNEPTDAQKKMIEDAIGDTVDAIKKAASTMRFERDEVRTEVTLPAEQRWRLRYYPMFRHAVVDKGLKWDDDKKFVLERAQQVGILAANLATIKAIIYACVRGEVEKRGQNVEISNAPTPQITSSVAELASLCIDCIQPDPSDGKPTGQWDWCTSRLSPTLEGFDIAKFATHRLTISYLINCLIDDL